MRVTSSFIRRASLWLPKAAGELWRETDGGWYGPGCGGCCCSIFTDDFNRADDTDLGADWSEVSGSWAITSNKLVASSTSGVAICTHSHSTASVRVAVTVRCPSANDLARIIFGYVDTSNYCFAEYKAGTSGSISLYSRISGSDTLLSSTAATTAHNNDISLCLIVLSDGRAVFTATGDSHYSTYDDVSPANGIVGLGTGGTVASSITFDDFSFSKATDSCPDCIGDCVQCDGHVAPSEMMVEVPPGGSTGLDGCCPGVGGTYILSRTSIANWATACKGTTPSGVCYWTLAGGLGCGGYQMAFEMEGLSLRLVIRKCVLGSSGALFQALESTNCTTFDRVPLPRSSSPGECSDFVGQTAYVTSL